MRNEVILLSIIGIVLIIDFVLRIIKKKSNTEKITEKLDGSRDEIKTNYILSRKRNIIAFLLLIAMLKPVIHFIFFEEKSDTFSTEKIDLGEKYFYSEIYLRDSIGNLNRIDQRSFWDLPNAIRYNINTSSEKLSENHKSYIKYGPLNRNGDPIYIADKKVFTYKRERLGFNEYFKERYTDKPFIFLISLAIIGLLSFLLNDKIKAR